MNQPYRANQSTPLATKEIETNDAFVEVIYLNPQGEITSKKREWLGNPSVTMEGSFNNKVFTENNWGVIDYQSWRRSIVSQQFITFEDQLIPIHRVLDIRVEIKPRTAVVDIKVIPDHP